MKAGASVIESAESGIELSASAQSGSRFNSGFIGHYHRTKPRLPDRSEVRSRRRRQWDGVIPDIIFESGFWTIFRSIKWTCTYFRALTQNGFNVIDQFPDNFRLSPFWIEIQIFGNYFRPIQE